MKWLAILNPAANRHDLNGLQRLARELEQNVDADCCLSRHAGHAIELARASVGYDGCIAVGGDGTIFEVVNGMDLATQVLGIMPAGTGNALACDLHLVNHRLAIEALRHPCFKPLDLVKASYRSDGAWASRYACTTSAIGYVAEVGALGLNAFKPLGKLRYAVAAVCQCWQQESFAARLSRDGGPAERLLLTNLTVNNSQHSGHFRLFPEAHLDDGKLNVLYENCGPVDQLLEDVGILCRTYQFNQSHHEPFKVLAIELERPTTLMLDGEFVERVEEVRFEVVRGGLQCCVREVAAPARISHQGSGLPARREDTRARSNVPTMTPPRPASLAARLKGSSGRVSARHQRPPVTTSA